VQREHHIVERVAMVIHIEKGLSVMDKDRIKGAAKQGKGKMKEFVGKVTGDEKTKAEGKADKAEGKVQNTYGGLKDKAREALDD
jgi:uncharacterized protein YjbJ (UPF0337 family)